MPLTQDRELDQHAALGGPEFGYPLAANVAIYRNALVGLCQDGTLVPAGTAEPASPIVAVIGVSPEQVTTVANAPVFSGRLTPRKGCWALPFDTAPGYADIGKPVYAVDDETVSLTETPASGSARLQVGTLSGLEADGTPFVLIA